MTSQDIDESDIALPADQRPKTPRWVKISGAIALALVLLVLGLVLSGGDHGPGRHMGPDQVSTPASSADVMPADRPAGHATPPGVHSP